jgi:hypothetical protein
MPDQPEAGHVGTRVDRSWQQGLQRFAGRSIQHQHRCDGGIHRGERSAAEFQRRRNHAGANRLGEHEDVAGDGAGVRQDSRRIDLAGDRVPELDLVVLHRVSAKQRHVRLGQRRQSPGEDRLQQRAIRIGGKRRNGERRERTAAHGVHVAEGVGCRDAAVDLRIVDDGGEEIDRLHERPALVEPVHTRIVRGPIVDEDPVVGLHGQIAQHLGELTSGEFARSTGTMRIVGQLLSRHRSSVRPPHPERTLLHPSAPLSTPQHPSAPFSTLQHPSAPFSTLQHPYFRCVMNS